MFSASTIPSSFISFKTFILLTTKDSSGQTTSKCVWDFDSRGSAHNAQLGKTLKIRKFDSVKRQMFTVFQSQKF